jgi:hypothetical protein
MRTDEGFFESIQEGDEIPALTKKPTYMQLFMFSAATWNRHLIHYNTEFARHFLAQTLSEWVGESGRVSKVEWSVRGGAFPGDVLTCRGKVVQKSMEEKKKRIICEVWVEKEEGNIIAPGKGEVTIFS